MKTVSLNGTWELRQQDKNIRVSATVPGCVHTDLRAAKLIPDPYYRDNELDLMWIGRSDWQYSRTFTVDSSLLGHDRVLLIFDGLDTLATVRVNGSVAGTADNAFRTWEFDVKSLLKTGDNEISVNFASVYPYAEKMKAMRPLAPVNEIRQYVRKSQCNYGWDWGPNCITAGIWRNVRLIGWSHGRISGLHIVQDHAAGAVGLDIRGTVEKTGPAALTAAFSVTSEGTTVFETAADVDAGGNVSIAARIDNPRLWWPNGMGEQPLYRVTMRLLRGTRVIDQWQRTAGLRTLVLDRHADQWGESFQFVVNGVPFFAKGANWIPADTFVTSIKESLYEELLTSAQEAHCNMLRVWGGGIYEPDLFYDICDRLGITVWQDFMFACSYYPSYDRSFVENVRQEIVQNVRRLRHHPSIALWCGNNEIEQLPGWLGVGNDREKGMMTWEEYGVLFDHVIPEAVAQNDPQRSYWPSSPHTPRGDRADSSNAACGDAHLWDVWHGRKPFEWYRTSQHRFNSEFGFQSFPEPKTVRTYTTRDDRNVTTRVMEHHQRSGSGNETILTYMLRWFRLPVGFDMTCWLSQIQQGVAIKYAVEHYRRNMRRCMGSLYWQINDCWPVASWASIDSLGNWKALHYMAKRFFAPVVLSILEDANKNTVEMHVSSDLRHAFEGAVRWSVTDTAGAILHSGEMKAAVAAGADTLIGTVNLSECVAAHGKYSCLVWAELVDTAGAVVSENFATFVRPKHIELQDPGLSWEVVGKEGAWTVTVRSERPALWTWIEVDRPNVRCSDNFFHLRGTREITLSGRSIGKLSEAGLRRCIRVGSLYQTYSEKPAIRSRKRAVAPDAVNR